MKSMKWRYGILLSLACGLTGCYFDGTSYEHPDYTTGQADTNVHSNNSLPAQHTQTSGNQASAAKDPVQKAAPGPKRTAAPQLPVIQ